MDTIDHPKYEHYKKRLSVSMTGNPNVTLTSQSGIFICKGYQRVVVGDRGPYVECNENNIGMFNLYINERDSWRKNNPNAYYIHYSSRDDLVKVYHQLRPVDYADYKVGLFYISPFDLFVDCNRLITSLRYRA